jgi:superfamily II DNA or RNA helicase
MTVKSREIIQQEARLAFTKCKGGKGTVCLSTGTGKSKVALDLIRDFYSIQTVLITSPRTNLKENWRKELKKWGWEHWGNDNWHKNFDGEQPERVVQITIENIQTAYKWKSDKHFNLIIADEVHTMMTPEYSALFENVRYDQLLGLTATHDITPLNDKKEYYDKYCPVIYEYYDSASDGIINKTNYKIVNHRLNNFDMVRAGTKAKPFMQGELARYEYLTKQIKLGQQAMLAQGSTDWFTDAGNWFWRNNGTPEQKRAAMKYLNAIKFRKTFLLNLTSTAKIAKKIKEGILSANSENKILLFSELTAQVDKLTRNTVHSHKDEKENQLLIDGFNEGKIRELGSCQSLTLGLNLKGATHAIMESYVGSSTRSKQKKGRLDRLSSDAVAEMWIINVLDTQSENWYNSMTKNLIDKTSNVETYNSITILNDGYNY